MNATFDYQEEAMDLLEVLRKKYNFSEGATFCGIKTADDISHDPYTAMVNVLSHKKTAESDKVNHFIEDYHGLYGKSISTLFEDNKESYDKMVNAFLNLIN